MAYEVELKARLRHPDETAARAAELGTFQGETFKEDVYFRRRGQSGPLPPDRYRLRCESGKPAVVTFKQAQRTTGVEVNEEVEFTVDDAHAFFRFADRFGFEPYVVKRKRSRVYRAGKASVELNEVEHLGHFVEIEILCNDERDVPPARTEIELLLLRLGLSAADVEPRPYTLLIQEAHPVQYHFVNDSSLDWPFVES